ncbi:DUF6920 family protein [Haladaptatus sp. NG-WS-4]
MRFKRFLRGVGVFVVGVFAAVFLGRIRLERKNTRLVGELLSDAASHPEREFSKDSLEGLPEPVQRYFQTVLEEGQPYVRAVRLHQRGEFRLGGATGAWKPLEATQHFTVDPPGFVWDAEIEMMPFVPTRVVDAYKAGSGSLHAKLLSTIPVADVEPSPEMDEGELLRYLGESVWFPTALLPDEGVEWKPIDDQSARAMIEHDGNTASLVFHFDDRDEVERVFAEGRYRQEDDSFEPWTGYFRNYQVRNGMRIPIDAEVAWNLPDGDVSYWRASIEEIEHE